LRSTNLTRTSPRPYDQAWLRRFCVLAVLAVAAVPRADAHRRAKVPGGMDAIPKLVFWAWERPEALEGLGSRRAVAYLATTVRLHGTRFDLSPRLHPLRVDRDTPLIAVVRIETDPRRPGAPAPGERAALARLIAGLAGRPGVRAVQIDFDARESERGFYRDLLAEVRAGLPARFPLSMTALASWCAHDNWLDGLPVDEAVPMLFRMGRFEARGFRQAGAANAWRAPLCRGSAGLATDEPHSLTRDGRRLYVFHPAAWTREALDAVAREWPQ
jgi:hypothetical protein